MRLPSFRVVKRQEPWNMGSWLVFGAALAAALVVCGMLLAGAGKPAWGGIVLLVRGGFGDWWSVQSTINKAIPIFLCSLGVAVTFRLRIWNIGAEGQFALGAIGATWAALTFATLPGVALLPLMFLSSAVCAGAWGFVPGYMRARWGVNEIIVTLMLNYVGILLLDYLVYGPWKDPASFGFPVSPVFSSGASIGRIPGTRIHMGLLFCAASALAVYVALFKSLFGYELRVCGEGERAARYARMPYGRMVIMVMVISGVFSGFAALFEVSAVLGRLQPSIMVGYGYTAIVVAWLARLHPLSIAVVSLLLAGLRVGVENLQIELQIPAAMGGIMEGVILLFILAGQFTRFYQFKRRMAEVGAEGVGA